MSGYIIRRLIYMVVTLSILSVVVFIVIQLPPGDYVTNLVDSMKAFGADTLDEGQILALRKYYGTDRSWFEQYFRWLTRFVRGDMGRSFSYERPTIDLLRERLPYTVLLSLGTIVFIYLTAIPIGIYAATHQYGLGDYLFTAVGLIGLSIPNFMLALILLYVFYRYFGISAGGLFSREFAMAPWSLAKAWDLFRHLWVPIIVMGTAGTAGVIRVMRGTLLDELGKQYVITARAKGVPERRLLFKYPVRVAINPIVSTIGWRLPEIVSGETITSIVLGLPTIGPLLFKALRVQDMFLAGSLLMVLGTLTVIGTLLSDILLVIVDPRIRMERRG